MKPMQVLVNETKVNLELTFVPVPDKWKQLVSGTPLVHKLVVHRAPVEGRAAALLETQNQTVG